MKLPLPPGPKVFGLYPLAGLLDYDSMHHFDDDDEPRCAHCHMPIYLRMQPAGDNASKLQFFHTLTLFKHCDAAMSKEATPERA